jgi:hypothetical protein
MDGVQKRFGSENNFASIGGLIVKSIACLMNACFTRDFLYSISLNSIACTEKYIYIIVSHFACYYIYIYYCVLLYLLQ